MHTNQLTATLFSPAFISFGTEFLVLCWQLLVPIHPIAPHSPHQLIEFYQQKVDSLFLWDRFSVHCFQANECTSLSLAAQFSLLSNWKLLDIVIDISCNDGAKVAVQRWSLPWESKH